MYGMPIEPSRKIVISTEIDQELAERVIDRIMEINDIDAERTEALKEYKPQPIEMFINSGGGSVTAGFAIIGAMEMSQTPIVTYGMGIVASMALAIFTVGDVRLAHRYCRFMYHSISYGMVGYIKDHEEQLKEADILQRMYNSLMLDNSKFKLEKLEQIREMKKDFFFSGKQAVGLGIADHLMQKPEGKFGLEEEMTEEEFQALEAELKKQLGKE